MLGPYLDRTSLSGPNIDLEPDPVFNLSAALHELASNAIKHGSLSRPTGRLELCWSVGRTERGMTLALDWVESNGPPVRRPRRAGFGSRLVDLVIERQLNGEVHRDIRQQRTFGADARSADPRTLAQRRRRWRPSRNRPDGSCVLRP